MFSFSSRNILAFTERKAAKKGREGVYIKHLFSVSFFSSRVIYLSLPSLPLFHFSPATASQARLFMLLLHFCVSLELKALHINLSYRMFSRFMKKKTNEKRSIEWIFVETSFVFQSSHRISMLRRPLSIQWNVRLDKKHFVMNVTRHSLRKKMNGY